MFYPTNGNRRVYEHIHLLAEDCGLIAKAKILDNSYILLELESNELIIHIKHFNPYEKLVDQVVGAKYRKEQSIRNLPFMQLPLFPEKGSSDFPDKAYIVLFYEDNVSDKRKVGNIYFVMPSSEGRDILGNTHLNRVVEHVSENIEPTKHAVDDENVLPDEEEDIRENQNL